MVDGDAALLHVEDGVLVELTDGGAVATLHVVAVDFELRLGVNLGGVGCHHIAVALIGFYLVCTLCHEYAAGKAAHRLVVEHIFK